MDEPIISTGADGSMYVDRSVNKSTRERTQRDAVDFLPSKHIPKHAKRQPARGRSEGPFALLQASQTARTVP